MTKKVNEYEGLELKSRQDILIQQLQLPVIFQITNLLNQLYNEANHIYEGDILQSLAKFENKQTTSKMISDSFRQGLKINLSSMLSEIQEAINEDIEQCTKKELKLDQVQKQFLAAYKKDIDKGLFEPEVFQQLLKQQSKNRNVAEKKLIADKIQFSKDMIDRELN